MQRRRSTPTNTSASAAPSVSTADNRNNNNNVYNNNRNNSNNNNTRIANHSHNHTTSSHSIELRDRPSHGASSSISYSSPYTNNPYAGVYRAPSSTPAAQPTSNTIFIMKPVVSAMQAWSCVVISVFAIVILSVLGLLFRSNHHEMVGGIDDPEDGPAVAATIFVAVLIYAGFLVFCGLQGLLHLRENRRGAIAL